MAAHTQDKATPANLTAALGLLALGCSVEVSTEHGYVLALPWDTGRIHRLLAAHPERRIGVGDWCLPSFDVIAGRAWPTPILPPEMRAETTTQTTGGATCFEMVARLSAAGCRPIVRGAYRWRALCPVCKMRGKLDRRVYIEREPRTGSDRLSSFCHCDCRDILAVLGLSSPRYAMGGKVSLG